MKHLFHRALFALVCPLFTMADPGVVPAKILRGGAEAPGPSSRRSALAVTEFGNLPNGRGFVEIYNSNLVAERVGGLALSGSLSYVFPPDATIGAGAYVVVTNDAPLTFPCEITLNDEIGAWITTIEAADADPWPVVAGGHTLVLARPSRGEANPAAWARSARPGGSPGAAEPARSTTYEQILLNELIPSGENAAGAIELINAGDASVVLSGCRLTRGTGTAYTFPAGTTLAGHALLAVGTDALGFPVNGAGDVVELWSPDGCLIDAARLPPTEPGRAWGRAPDAGPLWSRLASATPGVRNAARASSAVVLNELMFNPISEEKDDEYVELFNAGDADVSLVGWTLSEGIDYEFTSEVIPAGGYLVVPRKKKAFLVLYPDRASTLAAGNYSGSLANSSETVRLGRPVEVWDADAGSAETRIAPVEEVTYCDGGAWGDWADGGGSSLERIDARADARLAANWACSNEDAADDWVDVSWTGTVELGWTDSYGTPNEIQIGLQGAGECLVDSVELKAQGGANLVVNPSFENGMTGWRFLGTHAASSLESCAGAPNGGTVLHLRATDRPTTGGNGVRGLLTAALPTSGTATISLRAKRLKGCPEILVRVRGNWIEACGSLATTMAHGTPGRANSRVVANAAPAILDVVHDPILPASGEAVTVYARLADVEDIGSATLYHHLDGASITNRVTMRACEGGWWKGVIPSGPTTGTLVAFSVQATDGEGATARFPSDAPARECLVRYGETADAGTLGVYRFWCTAANLAAWTARSGDANDPVPVTFVYGNDRVEYRAGAVYGGSPFHNANYGSPVNSSGWVDYKFSFPKDAKVLDDDAIVLASCSEDTTGIREQYAYSLVRRLGLPAIHRRYVRLYANGTRMNPHGMTEDTEKPGGAALDHWFPDSADNELFKLDDWFEYPTNEYAHFQYNAKGATLERFVGQDGAYRRARYRWNWLRRAAPNFAENDYSGFFGLVDLMNLPDEALDAAWPGQIDVKSFVGLVAVNHFIGNYDSWGYLFGKNMYLHRATSGWSLFMWDLDHSFKTGGNFTLTGELDPMSDKFQCVDPVLLRFLRRPAVRSLWWQTVTNIVAAAAPASPEYADARAKYDALRAAGVGVSGFSSWQTNVEVRRTNALEQIASADFGEETRTSRPAVRVRINEVMAQNGLYVNPLTGQKDDWFELINDGNAPADLAGWVVTDTLATETPPTPSPKASKAYTFPRGVVLAPGETLRVWTGADGATDLPLYRDNLQAPFGLSKSEDQIVLFDADTNLVDRMSYTTTQSTTASLGRWPNASGEWRTLTPTPGAWNRLRDTTVALWPMERDAETGAPDLRCVIDARHDLVPNGLASTLLDVDWNLPPNPDASPVHLFMPTNQYSLTAGASSARLLASSTDAHLAAELLPTHDFTLEGWVRFDALPSANEWWVLANALGGSGGDGGWIFSFRRQKENGTALAFQIFAKGPSRDEAFGAYITDESAFTNVWHHVALVHDFDAEGTGGKSVWRFFLDGAAHGAVTNAQCSVTEPSTVKFELGGRGHDDHRLRGAFDYWRLSAAALAPEEFLNAGEEGGYVFQPLPTATAAYWPLGRTAEGALDVSPTVGTASLQGTDSTDWKVVASAEAPQVANPDPASGSVMAGSADFRNLGGARSYLMTADASVLDLFGNAGGFTVECYCRRTAAVDADWEIIFGLARQFSFEAVVFLVNMTYRQNGFIIYDVDVTGQNDKPFPQGATADEPTETWRHYALTFRPQNGGETGVWEWFVDGVSRGVLSGPLKTLPRPPAAFTLGGRPPNAHSFRGEIAHVRISRKPLAPREFLCASARTAQPVTPSRATVIILR